MRLIRNLLLLLVLGLQIAVSAFAVAPTQENKQEKIYIVSDSSKYNHKTGISTFSGNVKIDQGAMHIEAQEVIAEQLETQRIQAITAIGSALKAAHYWNVPQNKELPLHAYAHTIHYVPSTTTVSLKGNVRVQQGDNHFAGQLVFYNRNDQTITVPAIPKSRSTIIYKPS